MRNKGTPNKSKWGKSGQMKTVMLKIRVPGKWLRVLDSCCKAGKLVDGNRSHVVRKMVMRGLLSSMPYDPVLTEMVKEELDHY